MSVGIASSIAPGDVAATHPYTFVLMLVLVLIFGLETVAREAKTSIKITSFLHLWMAAYLVLLAFLMSVTTAMALVLVFDPSNNHPRFTSIPASFAPMAAAVLGVFGFEFLFRKFIVGFGEVRFDLAGTLQGILDQAVAATLKREAP